MSWLSALGASLLALGLLLSGCSDGNFNSTSDAGGGEGAVGCESGTQRCLGQVRQGCKNNAWIDLETCANTCVASLARCGDCDPAQGGICDGDDLFECTPDGLRGSKLKTCPAGQCVAGRCQDACSKAAQQRSYEGCEYWPTVTSNASLVSDFSFAVVVANPQVQAVDVVISTQTSPSLKTVTLQPGAVETIELPWVNGLKNPASAQGEYQSSVVAGGAYHLLSTLPVTVYQFNPLNYLKNGDCTGGFDPTPNDNKCHSYSNDASLLLPAHVQTKEYMIVSRPTMMLRSAQSTSFTGSPGFFAIVATAPGDTQVKVDFAGAAQAGPGIKAYQAGETAFFTIPQWGVLQILSAIPPTCTPKTSDASGAYCDLSATSDLTGTRILAKKPVAVFSGHNCTFVPYDKWACDHLEEQLFPLSTWGKRYIATHTVSSGNDPAAYRVLSAAPGNTITFTNGVASTVTLGEGKFIEFATTKDFEVSGTGRFTVVQFMVGQSYSAAPGAGAPGDPAMALAVPVEQYRRDYRFLAPASFAQNYVNVIAAADAQITLDGKAVTGFTAIPGSTYRVAKVKISGGVHNIEGSSAFGISVYGVGDYTSYMYPGGLDLKLLQ
ncbi:MAG: hypothetical protein CSA65_07685 [Proteobacteria bacterium]|nr:MAG: hypothetical protein CSA65_07685 [Pseudomonadota bacterium]